jgi:Trk-type K+ transport system membrane component
LTKPGQLLVFAFLAAIALMTAVLSLPFAREPSSPGSFTIDLFTATGSVTGALPLVDTGGYWSLFGEVAILVGIQVGGLGFMVSATLLGLLVTRRLGLRTRLAAATETQSVSLGDVRRVVRSVATIALVVETATALALWPRLAGEYDESIGRAAYNAVFLSISAFNNAGLALYSDNLVQFAADPWVLVPIGLAALIGGLGLPVLIELRAELGKPRLWSVHTKTTLVGFALITVVGGSALALFEWRNDETLGALSTGAKVLNGWFGSIAARAGFNTFDYGAADSTTLLTTDALMFIGGGSASTAGGIKITTFLLLFFAIAAEVRGEDRVNAFGREMGPALLRQALTVALLGVAVVVCGTMCLLASSPLDLEPAMFEVFSAFGTVGLSTGVTDDLPTFSQYVLIVLMIVGRLGPITLASALALRERHRLYRLPEERPIVG